MADFPLGAPTRDQFRELWHRLWQFAERNPKSAIFLELHHHADYLDADSHALEARVMEPILSFVRMAQTQSALKPLEPELLVAVVYGAFIQVAKQIYAGQLTLGPDTLSQAEACVWEAVRA